MYRLNSLQRKIIKTINGPILVIAGAGSGKTRILTHRIVHMINNIGINPSNILALTFTNKAAKEMKNRISNMMNETNFNLISLGTFHSIFSGILRKESHWLGYKSNYTIYDQKDSENVIKKILEDTNVKTSFSPKNIIKKISEYKNNFFDKLRKKKEFYYKDIKKIYKIYVKKCSNSEALDFDDILLHTNYLFFRFPKILHKYQEKFQYILIDEYQDTNLAQNIIIKNLSSKYRNVFAVGDDAQSIYAFRGANISNILNFHKDYNEAKIFRLEQNYRSTNHIVEASNKIISFNKNQLFKKIWTKNEKGDEIKIYGAFSEKEEAQYIADYILFLKKIKKFQNKDFAILYRTNSQSNILEYAMKENNIPYKIGGSISFYKRKEIQDLLAYFRIINNPKDEESLLRIIKKKINNKKTVKLLLIFSQKKNEIFSFLCTELQNRSLFYEKDYLWKVIHLTINRIIENFRLKLKDKNIYEIAQYIVKFLLKKEKKNNYNHDNFQLILDNISYYINDQKKLKKNGDISLSGFLQYFSLREGINENKEENKVSLMTIHLSKGLEFPVIFITGLEENLFPSKSSLENQLKLEEERRLFYVALTRAQKKAILTYTKYRFLWGKKIMNIPSRFIHEINEKFIEKKISISNYSYKLKTNNYEKKLIKKGIKVFHKNFGIGTIIDIQRQNEIAIIKFQQSGEKKILLKLAKLIIYS
ncbi:ATP-dependent helicase [Blattabacterium sp. (Cryptocercus punctulatus) str. Cpu]|uniref:ATP-dependent helicase n=1 Tax=Blattabacterium sp. (Cryptocercus punctulatus) str. Cpu TaxID=1075399 RepID=UPI000238726F|nr:UvrD-helicase domain-containing protein [Blattabacterium sp. (Cryptocercus punctulatus) str. Cpu]AEU09194.1 ATP-dependent DNA helicase UvrD [Blattabacterium sp. (Cryptocercus punctulatus) str. Cpu]